MAEHDSENLTPADPPLRGGADKGGLQIADAEDKNAAHGRSHGSGAAPKTLFAFQYELLVTEIKFIQSRIAAYDGLSFKIKGWAVTLWSAVIGLGVKEKTPLLILASFPVLLVFWVLDAIFKQYQRRSMTRMGAIEKFFDSREPFVNSGLREAFAKQDFGDFPIHDPIASRTKTRYPAIGQRYATGTRFWACFGVGNVSAFYLILAFSAAIILILLLLAPKSEVPLMPHAE